MTHCINCNQEVSTAYCPACGQRNPVKKINMVNMWSDFAARVYGFDGMFPRTLRDLTIRPGQVAREYIKGNRVKYYGPVGYFFLTLTIYLLLASLLDVDLVKLMISTTNPELSAQGNEQAYFVTELTSWTINNMRSISFFITLFITFFTWLFFRKSKYNFVESGVLVFFVSGHSLWLIIVQLLIFGISGFVLDTLYLTLASILFMIFAFSNFYDHVRRLRAILTGVMVHVFSYLLIIIVTTVVFTYKMVTDKELQEKLKQSNDKPKVEQNPAVK